MADAFPNTVKGIDPREPDADLKMMRSPDYWPRPVLCLLNEDGRLGLMFNTPEVPRHTVYLLNRFDPRVKDVVTGQFNRPDLIEGHDSCEAIIAAGWRVD